jgi:hypothetical protein
VRARRGAEQTDARRVDAKSTGLAADELHAGEHIVHRFGKCLGFRGEPVGDGEERNAASGEIGSPILKGTAHAANPAAAMHGD